MKPVELNPIELPGVCAAMGELGPGSIIFEDGLAKMVGRCPVSIKRAVARGELPAPIRLLGRCAWTAGSIVKHLEQRQASAAKTAEREAKRFADLQP